MRVLLCISHNIYTLIGSSINYDIIINIIFIIQNFILNFIMIDWYIRQHMHRIIYE